VKTSLSAVAAIVTLGLATAPPATLSAYAADQYDGKWVGTAPDKGDCGVLTVTMIIGGSTICGNVSGKHGSPTITSGKVEGDGTARVVYTATLSYEGTLRFPPDRFEGQFMTMCGLRDVVGARQ
jgi:hypothetical protein